MNSRRASKTDSPPIVYINPRPPAVIPPASPPPPPPPPPPHSASSHQHQHHHHQMAPSYSRSSSSLGHNPSSSTSITTLLGLLNQNGRESPPPATPLSPRPCVSRKASAARILNSHSHSDINISNNTAPSASASGSASASASATGPGHRRSLSGAVSMTSFPVVNDTDVMTTFGASHPSNIQRLPHNNNDNSNSSHRSPALTYSRGNRTLDDASAAMLTAAFQTQGFPVPRTVTATTTQSPVPAPAPAPAPPSTPASTSPARKARRAATIGIASPAHFNSPSSARSESVHQHVISTTTSPQSYTSAIMASPTKKVVTIANQYASTQELKEWGSNFWVVITDPGTGENFFANPHTGECRWEVPPGTFVLPPNPDGQWVEFFDEQHDLPYFFHSGRKASQWERPPGFVIPLTTIQEVNMGRPFGAPAGARRTPRVSIGSDPGGAAQSALLLEDVDLSAATAADTSSSSNSNPNANGNGSAQGSAHARTAISPSSVVTFADEPSKKSERRKSIQPPPPAQSPSIDQVLAYRRSLSLGKNELLARALASNLIGMGAPYGTSANAAGGEAVTSILNLGEESEVLRAGDGGGVGNGSAGASRSRNGNGNWSGHQRRRSEPIDNPPVPGTPTSVIGDLVSSPQSSPPRARASTSTAPATPNHPTQTPSSSAMAGVVRRLVLGPKLLSDEMEHIRDIPTPLSQINEDHNNNRGRGDRDRDRDRDSMNSFFNPRSHVRNSQASGTSSTGGAAGGGGGGDDTASISSAGTDFMMNLASGRLFGSTSSHQHQHSKTGSGSGAGAGGASGSGFTVSGPGGGASGNGYGRGGGGGGGGNGESGSIRDSITSRSSSALGGGFAPIAEENHQQQQQQQQYQQTSGITVKVTRPSTSTDGASLASKSGRWTPEFGGAVSSWRRDVGWGGESSASVSSVGVGAGAGIPASSSSSNSHSNGNGGGGSAAGGANGGGGGPPQLRERESLRNMRSPPTSGRTAAVVSAQHQQSGSGSSSQRPSSLHSHHSSQHSADSSAGNGIGFLALPQEPANHHTWDSAHTVVGRAGAGNAAGANAGAGNASGTAAARANTWSTSTWRTNGGATSNSGAASVGKASSRRGGSGSPPMASMMWQASGNGSAGSGKSGFGRFGGGGSTTLSSSLYHSSNGGGMDETKETSYDYDSSSRSTHGVGNASPSPTPIKSPKLFSALRSKLRIATSSNASSSSHNHMHGSATGNGSSSTTTHSSSTRDRSFDSQGVMHIADRSAAAAAAKAAAGLEEEKSLPETPEEAYNRRRMHQAPPSPLSATFVGSGAGGRGGGSSRAGSGGLYTIPSRSGSLSVVGLGGGYPSPLAPSIGAVSTLGSAASPPLPQSQAQPQPQGAGGGGVVVPTSGTMAGLVRSSSTPSLGFSPNSLTTPSLDSDSSGQHDAAAVLGGSYGLGVGLPTTANGNGNGNGAAENNNNNNSKVPFRPSGVTDVVLNSRHTSLLASPFEADPPRNVAAADGRFRDPEVSAFDALLKGYSGSETQVLKRVKAAVVGGAESPTTTTTTGRKWF